MAVTGYLSGVEAPQHFGQCVKAGVKHVLMSYWQFYKHDLRLIKRRKLQHPDMTFMVDSGAFTFINSYQKFADWKKEKFEEYVEGYVRWLNDNRQYVTTCVEMDIDYTLNMILGGNANSTVGTSIVEGWQRDLFRPLVNKGVQVVFVWHDNRGLEGWEDMCRRYDYVGMPGFYSNEPEKINRHFSVARRYLTKVHGFAATKQIDFRDVPWFSVDSITWKSGEIYGTLTIWDRRNQRLFFEPDCKKRGPLRHLFEEAGFNADAIITGRDYREVTRFGLWSMRQMELHYERLYATRTPYYAVRLPPRPVLLGHSDEWITAKWQLFRPDVIFGSHAGATVGDIRKFLCALSAAQSGELNYIAAKPIAKEFLHTYFPKLIEPMVTDGTVLQKEVAAYVMPPNPPPTARTAAEHFEFQPSKQRELLDLTAEDLEFKPYTADLETGAY